MHVWVLLQTLRFVQVPAEENALVVVPADAAERLGGAAGLLLAEVHVAHALGPGALPREVGRREEHRGRCSAGLHGLAHGLQSHPEEPPLRLLLPNVHRAMLDLLKDRLPPEDVALSSPPGKTFRLLHAGLDVRVRRERLGDGVGEERVELLGEEHVGV